ncbi:hypothetical protein ABFX02_02G174100 [Erythranthe guttata]
MGAIGSWNRETVVSVLTEGRERANELKNQLHPAISSIEACDVLLESILSSYENALHLLDHMSQLKNSCLSSQIVTANSFDASPISEGSHQNSKDHHQIHKSKKRKTLPKWSEHVRISSGAGFEGQIGDGYNWRKYGQKVILGANHPRAYYRCTHRNTQGCLATKHVQKADEDPSVFEVVYSGKHSCMQERSKPKKENPIVLKKEEQEEAIEKSPKPQNQETGTKNNRLPSFSFHSTPIESENFETQLFSEPGNFSGTPFMSPATSESYFSMNDFGVCLQSSESDFTEIISNPTPFTDFTFGDLDFSIDQVDFDSHFLDAPEYF